MTERALSICLWAASALAALAFMEAWAALLHGRVWHALLWRLHRSHHSPRRGRFEANDLLSVTHVPIALGLILYGCLGPPGVGRDLAYGWGIGMSAFGLLYFTFHDGLVHGRLPVQSLLRFRIVRLWKQAHLVHHRRGRGPYGFFYVPAPLRDELRAKVDRHEASSPVPHRLRLGPGPRGRGERLGVREAPIATSLAPGPAVGERAPPARARAPARQLAQQGAAGEARAPRDEQSHGRKGLRPHAQRVQQECSPASPRD